MRLRTYLDAMRKNQGSAKKVGHVVLAFFALVVALAPAILTSKFGFGFSPILTGSMRPIAQPGDVYVTRLVPADSLKVGDVIAVNNQVTGVYYSHRITEIRPMNNILRITTKGDANALEDRDPFMASPQGEVSVVVARIPWIGRPMVYMNTVQGRQTATSLIVIANVLALFAFLFRKKIVQNFTHEHVYRELYAEERKNSEQYRQIIDDLQTALRVEVEEKEKVRSN